MWLTFKFSTSGFDFQVMSKHDIPVNWSRAAAGFALLEDDLDTGDMGDMGDMRDWFSSLAWAAWAATISSSILLLRHSSSYILISHISVVQASSQLLPRLSFRTLFRLRP